MQLVPTGSCGCDCGLKAIFLSHPVTFFFDSLETVDFLLIAYILGALSVDINGIRLALENYGLALRVIYRASLLNAVDTIIFHSEHPNKYII